MNAYSSWVFCPFALTASARQLQSLVGQERGLTTPLGDMRIRRKTAFNFAAGRVNSGCCQTGSKSSACPKYAGRFAEKEIDVYSAIRGNLDLKYITILPMTAKSQPREEIAMAHIRTLADRRHVLAGATATVATFAASSILRAEAVLRRSVFCCRFRAYRPASVRIATAPSTLRQRF